MNETKINGCKIIIRAQISYFIPISKLVSVIKQVSQRAGNIYFSDCLSVFISIIRLKVYGCGMEMIRYAVYCYNNITISIELLFWSVDNYA